MSLQFPSRRPSRRSVLLVIGLVAACTAVGSLASCSSPHPGQRAAAGGPKPPTEARTTTPPKGAVGPIQVATSTTVAATTTTAAPTTTVAPGPPYPLRQLTVPLVDTSRPTVSHGQTVSSTRSLPTLVWYPDRAGRWPLLVFAHGFQVGPQPYVSLLEAWASHGYVVAAPVFPLTDQAVAGAELDEADINNQPADVRFVTDRLIAPSSPVAIRIDPARVAVAGHSDGAETALAASTDPVPAGKPAYRAAVILSGQPVPGAPGRNPPILIAQGDVDDINPPDLGYSAWDQAASPKYLLVMRGGGHLPPYEAGSPWLPGIVKATETMLDAYVARDVPVTAMAGSVSGLAGLSMRAG